MRILSLWRPWSFSIFYPDESKRKPIENRTWPAPPTQIGKRIALQDAHGFDETAFELFRENGIADAPMRWDAYPSGVIVGVVTIDRVVVADDSTLTESQRRWYFGNAGWVLSDPRRLPNPIAFKGAQGLRDLPASVTREILGQLAIPINDRTIDGFPS